MKNLAWLACLLSLIFACKGAPDYKPKEFSQSSIVSSRLAYLDENFTAEQLCEDFQFFLKLRTYLQNDKDLAPVSEDCPTDFKDFVLKVKAAIHNLNDLHTQVLFGNGLDANNYPVITGCEGDTETCESLLGSPVYPVPSNVETNFYAGVFSKASKLHPFEVQAVNENPVLSFRAAMDKELLYSHTKSNWAQNLMEYVLKRASLGSRDRSALTIRVRSLSSGKILVLKTSYDSIQKVFPNAEAVASLHTIAMGREYGCSNAFELSTFDIGACQRADGKTIIWLANWPQAEAFEDWQKSLTTWLEGLKVETLYLDMRSNAGGSPLSPISFLCRFGDDDTVKAIAKTKLSIRSFPKQFVLKGKTISSESLDVLDNLELKKIDMDFEVRSGSSEEARYHEMSTFERSKLNEEGCKGLRAKNLNKTKWKVLTDGGEFSAGEDFLLLAKASPKKFQIYGRPSVGGAGNPSWISLPHTKAGVRLSLARTLFDDRAVIEKVGVTPDYFIQEQETAAEIEARMLRFIDKGMLAKSDFIPQALFDKFYK